MNLIGQVIKQQSLHLDLIYRLALYDVKSNYKMHYFGGIWQIMQPLLQIGVYWFVFGLGIRGGAPIGDTPFFLWLLPGIVPWLFIAPTIAQAANSIYLKIGFVSKMNFPVSILPSIKIIGNSFSFIAMLVITILILLVNGVFSGIYLVQLFYYLACLYVLLFGLSLLFSTLTTIIRDFQNIIQAAVRMSVYFLPVLWNVNNLPTYLVNILKLNPFFYIIEGFRASLLGGSWFYQDLSYAMYFWSVSLLILLVGSKVHVKFRDQLVDYI